MTVWFLAASEVVAVTASATEATITNPTMPRLKDAGVRVAIPI